MMRLLHTLLVFCPLIIIFTQIAESTTDNKSLQITKGINGLDKVILGHTPGCSVEVYLYGAHVTSWKNQKGEELIFVSSKATFTPPKPIRGGIPTIFPQFSNLGSLPSHGFARNRLWTVDDNPPPNAFDATNGVFVDLLLKPTQEDLNIWPHKFEFRLRVALTPEGDLVLASHIKNTDDVGKPFTFTFAHHTYFSISDISEVEVRGMAGLDYLDNVQNRTRYTEHEAVIKIESEFDRIYLNTPEKVAVLDQKKKQTYAIQKDGLPDAVVWNPGETKAKTMVDLGEGEYKYMVCVEAAAIGKPVTLNPGEEWKGRLQLSTQQ